MRTGMGKAKAGKAGQPFAPPRRHSKALLATNRVAEWVHHAGNVVCNAVGQLKGVARGQRKEVSKGAGAVHANAVRVDAEVLAPAAAVPAVTAGDMALARYAVADLEATNALTNGLDHTAVLVARNHGGGYGAVWGDQGRGGESGKW